MKTPPHANKNADAAPRAAAPRRRAAPSSRTDPRTPDANPAAAARRPALAARLRAPLLFLVAFAALVLLHLTLLGLPYYWDEAGYFIPAARDIYDGGSFVPHSTLSNAHPPLVMAYLALAWKLFGFHVEVARVAMLAVAALALAGLFRLAERVACARVAAATLLCTAAYPVFFAQSSLAHLDMTVAALTLWALSFYLPSRTQETASHSAKTPLRARAACVALLALAALAKETAVLVPLTLCAWELLCLFARGRERLAALVCLERRRRSAWWSLSLLLACAPLAAWFAYHRARTGYTFGNPEYFRYNVESTLNLARFAEALWGRLRHVTFHMNLWVLTLAGLAAMFLKPRREAARAGGVEGGRVRERERERIAVPVQLLFLALILAHVLALSAVGGAVLARYMLPVVPLVILVWVSTLRRRVPAWPLVVALVCGAFAYRCVVNPSYNFPWEENLAYADFVRLHRDAARFLSENYAGARVLTCWPATDELRNPYYGYTPRPLAVFPVESLKREDLTPAAAQTSRYDAALLYSTHGGLALEEAAQLLGARVVFREERKGQWVAVVVGR